METLYGNSGAVVGWLRDDSILDLDGSFRAFLRDGHIYAFRDGTHVGWFEHGWLWDSNMQAVAFQRDATGGPARPGLGGRPGTPGIPGKPGYPGTSGIPGRPGRSNSWSTLGWERWAPAAV